MIRRVIIDERSFDIEFQIEADTCRFRVNGGDQRSASLIEVEPGIYSVLLDGLSYEIQVVPGDDCLHLDSAGRRYQATVDDPRRSKASSKLARGGGTQHVTAPMPGKVVRLLVAEGEAVERGQGLLVVEAMKMQNEMKAPRGGVVIALHAREGTTVAAGEVLASVG